MLLVLNMIFGHGIKLMFNDKQIDSQIDVIIEEVELLLWAGKWDIIDEKLNLVNVELEPLDILLSWLSMTFVEKSKLKNYNSFFESVKKRIELDGEDSVELLRGLE